MIAKNSPSFLLASPDPGLLSAIEPMLLALGARVDVVLSIEAALAVLDGQEPPAIVLLDERLPGMDPRMEIDRFLAAVHADDSRPLSVLVIADAVSEHWLGRLDEGVIDDLIPRAAETAYWRLRMQTARRNLQSACELESFREAAALNAQLDRLTGVCNRETILQVLFRETDRVQRLKGSLSLVLVDIDDFGHWNSRLGNEACDDLLCQVAGRISRLLRSYDALGRPGKDEFLLVLPGCTTVNAAMLAERMRVDVFCSPFHVAGESIRLSACFGIASSKGRSPIVVLREAEQALQWARADCPDSLQCFGDHPDSGDASIGFFTSPPGKENPQR